MPKLLHRIFIAMHDIVFDIKNVVSVISSVLYIWLCYLHLKFNEAQNLTQELVKKVTQGNWDPENGQVVLQWEFSFHHSLFL